MKKQIYLIKKYDLTGILILFLSFSVYSQSQQTWYNNAQERIDTLRKGNFGLKIFDKNGQPYSGEVSVKMIKHEFPFGIAFDFYEGEIIKDIPTETQWIKANMYKYFNYGVTGNSFKWSGIQPQHTAPNYTNFEHAVKWTQKVGWELRAHTLLWGGVDYNDHHPMPKWVKDLPTPRAITDTCKMRVIREMTRYKGVVKEYDVINEPLHATYLQSVVGDSINWNCFKWAHSADPEAQLFINEYNVEYGWGDAKKYRDLILKIKEKGGPVTGVGMQSHFWNGLRPDISDFINQINTVAEAGLPIKLTEFDYGGDLTQKQQAEDLIKVFKIAFSYPSINGIICWGFCDKNIWRENTGFFDKDHKPKLAADTLLYLTKKLWATNFDSTLSENEALVFNAYYGDYSIEVKFEDTVKVFHLPCLKINEDSVFVLHENDAVIKGPQLINTQLVNNTQLNLNFDKPINGTSINKYDFRFFSNNLSTIGSISIDPENDSVIKIILTKQPMADDYITISYFPGSLISTDGGKATAIGPVAINNPFVSNIGNMFSNADITIYPIPASTILNIDGIAPNSSVSVFNSTGVLIYSGSCNSLEKMQIDVTHFNKGIYFVNISSEKSHSVVRKIVIN